MHTSNRTIFPDELARNVEAEMQAREELAKRTPTISQSLIGLLWIGACAAGFSDFPGPWPLKLLLMLPAQCIPFFAFELHSQRKRLNAALVLLRLSGGR